MTLLGSALPSIQPAAGGSEVSSMSSTDTAPTRPPFSADSTPTRRKPAISPHEIVNQSVSGKQLIISQSIN